MSLPEYAPLALFGALWLLITLSALISERRDWNGGICPETGESWRYFASSSQGCRGYVSGEHYIWISWPVDRLTPADGEQSKETDDE